MELWLRIVLGLKWTLCYIFLTFGRLNCCNCHIMIYFSLHCSSCEPSIKGEINERSDRVVGGSESTRWQSLKYVVKVLRLINNMGIVFSSMEQWINKDEWEIMSFHKIHELKHVHVNILVLSRTSFLPIFLRKQWLLLRVFSLLMSLTRSVTICISTVTILTTNIFYTLQVVCWVGPKFVGS